MINFLIDNRLVSIESLRNSKRLKTPSNPGNAGVFSSKNFTLFFKSKARDILFSFVPSSDISIRLTSIALLRFMITLNGIFNRVSQGSSFKTLACLPACFPPVDKSHSHNSSLESTSIHYPGYHPSFTLSQVISLHIII